jgi:hypothetical protein
MASWKQIEAEAPELAARARALFDGTAEEVTSDEVKQAVVGGNAPPGPLHLFRADITELVVISLGGDPPDHMVLESWHAGRGVTTRKR